MIINNLEVFNKNLLSLDNNLNENKFINNISEEVERLYHDDKNDFVKTNYNENSDKTK